VIQQARRRKRERARANRDNPGTAGGGPAQRRAHLLARIIQRQVSGHHDGVRGGQRLQAMLSLHRKSRA
jgi:hypothetical protein